LKPPSTAAAIAGFIGKYAPAIGAQLKAARARLRKMFPRGCALVFGFAPGERASEAILSVAAYPRWVTLFFLEGVKLEDPRKLLQGGGSTVRSIRLENPKQLDDPAVRELIDQAIDRHREAFRAAGPLRTVIKSVSAKQRARRPSA